MYGPLLREQENLHRWTTTIVHSKNLIMGRRRQYNIASTQTLKIIFSTMLGWIRWYGIYFHVGRIISNEYNNWANNLHILTSSCVKFLLDYFSCFVCIVSYKKLLELQISSSSLQKKSTYPNKAAITTSLNACIGIIQIVILQINSYIKDFLYFLKTRICPM